MYEFKCFKWISSPTRKNIFFFKCIIIIICNYFYPAGVKVIFVDASQFSSTSHTLKNLVKMFTHTWEAAGIEFNKLTRWI